MRCYHLTSVHPSNDVRIFFKECVSLKNAEYDVSLVAQNDKYESVKGVNVIPLNKATSRVRRFIGTTYEVYRKAVQGKADIYHFHDPELIPVGLILRLYGKKVVYDVHEDLPIDILSKSWIAPWVRYPVSWVSEVIEWIASQVFFTAVVAATPTIAKRFPARKTVIIQNYPIPEELFMKSSKQYSQRPENIVYVGGITKIRGAIENIQAFESVRHENCSFVLVGDFESSQLEEECTTTKGWGKVEYMGWLSRDQVAEVLGNARVGLVLLHPLRNYIDAYPVKMFEYMAAGIPVIASDFPLWRKIVEGAQCGLLVDPMQPTEIAKAIDWLLDNPEEAEKMGTNGMDAVRSSYNWAHEEKKLLELYRSLES